MTSKLLPTPSSRDWKGASNKPRDTVDSLVENQATKNHTYLPADSPASPLVQLALDVERPMTAISGQKCFRLYNLSNQHGSSLRTCVDYLLGSKAWYSNKSALIWKPKVMMSSRLLFQLSPSTLRIEGTESGLLLATPNTLDNMEPKTDKAVLKEATVTRKGRTKMSNLRDQMWHGILLKTPSASEAEGGAKVQDKYWDAKAPKFKMRDQVGRATGLKLQPNFVAWMMGFPLNWTDLNSVKPKTGKNN